MIGPLSPHRSEMVQVDLVLHFFVREDPAFRTIKEAADEVHILLCDALLLVLAPFGYPASTFMSQRPLVSQVKQRGEGYGPSPLFKMLLFYLPLVQLKGFNIIVASASIGAVIKRGVAANN